MDRKEVRTRWSRCERGKDVYGDSREIEVDHFRLLIIVLLFVVDVHGRGRGVEDC